MSETESSTPPLDTPPPAPTIPANAGRETTAPPEATAVDAPVMGGDTVLSPTLENAALTTTAQETEKTVKSKEGRDLLKWLYEKVTPNIVQDLVERVKVWGNDKLAIRADNQIKKLKEQKVNEEEKNTKLTTSIQTTAEKLARVESLLKETPTAPGEKQIALSEKVRAKLNAEKTTLEKMATEARKTATALGKEKGPIATAEAKKTTFEAKAETARKGLTDKLDSKIKGNEGEIKKQTTEKNNLEIKIGDISNCGAVKPRFNVKKDKILFYMKRFLPARNLGILIISTNQGLITHVDAIDKNIGGSLIAYFY